MRQWSNAVSCLCLKETALPQKVRNGPILLLCYVRISLGAIHLPSHLLLNSELWLRFLFCLFSPWCLLPFVLLPSTAIWEQCLPHPPRTFRQKLWIPPLCISCGTRHPSNLSTVSTRDTRYQMALGQYWSHHTLGSALPMSLKTQGIKFRGWQPWWGHHLSPVWSVIPEIQMIS